MEILAILLFVSIFVLILYGYPVAFMLGGLSMIYAVLFLDVNTFTALPARFMGVVSNYVLLAVPLFIFMGIMLERSGLAEQLLDTMGFLLGRIRGGLAIAVIVVGAMLAASTGIVGVMVITMGLISLPTMLKRGYRPELATGTVAASGTLGQIIPPSIVLVLLGSVLQVSVGDLFAVALLPGLSLVALYIGYIMLLGRFRPDWVPALSPRERETFRKQVGIRRIAEAFVLPLLLILCVLGAIFAGLASPTEAAAIGAAGAIGLTVYRGKFAGRVLRQVMQETTHLTSMVFFILLGATTFSLVFRELGGDTFLLTTVQQARLSPLAFLLMVMLVVFVSGFFLDFIEIVFIVVPIVAPLFQEMGINLLWVGVLLGLNLQTSFLTPPFGFSLFYLKGVAPASVTTMHLYRGILPFVLLQAALLIILLLFPSWLPVPG
jgi:tripartite ATP-independent transporter DctM subunit